MLNGVRHLSPEEFARLYHQLTGRKKHRNRAMAMLQATTGFRITEVLSLLIGDVWQQGKVVPRIQVNKRFMKRKIQSRNVIVTPILCRDLTAYISHLRRAGLFDLDAPLFHHLTRKQVTVPGPTGDIITWRKELKQISRFVAYRAYNQAARRAGIEGRIGTHSFRKLYGETGHGFTSDVSVTAALLGQKDPRSTMHYLALGQDKLDRVTGLVAAEIEKAFL
jgi:integrase